MLAGLVATNVSVSPAAAHAAPPGGSPPRVVKVDVVGDAYLAGEGLSGTYFDAADVRHQSRQSAPAQALARLAEGNPGTSVDMRVAASSGAATTAFFAPQQRGETVVNAPQRDQIRPDANVVLVGFGGTDTVYNALLVASVIREDQTGGAPAFDALTMAAEPLLSTMQPDRVYLEQAAASPPGLAPTLTARLLQVLAATKSRAPQAAIVVTNYPVLVHADRSRSSAELTSQELGLLLDHVSRLNAAIERAVRICRCATLADVSGALADHEAFSADPAVNPLPAPTTGRTDDHRLNETLHPNLRGARLLAGPMAAAVAEATGLKDTGASPAPDATAVPGFVLDRAVPDRDADGAPDLAPPPPASHQLPEPPPLPSAPAPKPAPPKAKRPEATGHDEERAPVPPTAPHPRDATVSPQPPVVYVPVAVPVPVVVPALGTPVPEEAGAEDLLPVARPAAPTPAAEEAEPVRVTRLSDMPGGALEREATLVQEGTEETELDAGPDVVAVREGLVVEVAVPGEEDLPVVREDAATGPEAAKVPEFPGVFSIDVLTPVPDSEESAEPVTEPTEEPDDATGERTPAGELPGETPQPMPEPDQALPQRNK